MNERSYKLLPQTTAACSAMISFAAFIIAFFLPDIPLEPISLLAGAAYIAVSTGLYYLLGIEIVRVEKKRYLKTALLLTVKGLLFISIIMFLGRQGLTAVISGVIGILIPLICGPWTAVVVGRRQ